MSEQLEFFGELKSVSQTKVVSLDNVYTLKLVTEGSSILDLGKLPPDTLLKVVISVSK